MSLPEAPNHDWFESGDGCYCFTFVRDVAPEEALRRIGAEPVDDEEEADEIDEGLVDAYPVEGGTLLVEHNGYAGTLDEVQRELSAGTVTAAVFRNVNHDQMFTHWAGGREILNFNPQFPADSRGGEDPDRHLAEMRALGLVTENGEDGPDAGVHRALALAARLTGMPVTALPSDGVAHGVLDH
ncbi:DUF6461 domain-containing protein [Streptosporangium sandarakinum]